MHTAHRRDHPLLGRYAAVLRAALRDVEVGLLVTSPGEVRAVGRGLLAQGRPPMVNSRLFAVVVAGAAGAGPLDALPVAVLSCLWWTGVETMRRDPAQLPMRYLDSLGLRTPLREAWARDLVHSAETRARPIARTPRDVFDGRTSRRGTAYAREAVMAARTRNDAGAGAWLRFGERYGVLADQAAACTSAPAHTTPPLLITHALATTSTYRRQHLVRLSQEAHHDVSARLTLRDLSCSPAAVSAYHRDLVVMRDRARACLAELGSPGPFTALLHGDLDSFLRRASVWTREVFGATHDR